jgi:hypothetical protein
LLVVNGVWINNADNIKAAHRRGCRLRVITHGIYRITSLIRTAGSNAR